ncbi:hypothetical protein PS6_007367 [Mucor atramentarius]
MQSSFPDSSDSTATKIPKLTAVDKENIKSLYDGQDITKIWKLSTGKIVEDQMKEVALCLENEDPSHSLILDITDSCWHDVFSPAERDEICGFQSIDLPNMSNEAEDYLQKLGGLDEVELLAKLESDELRMETDSNWIQKSYRDAFRLLRSDFFPLQNQTEGNVVKRVWSCVGSCFDFSSIKCVSRASADAGNKVRSASDIGRQFSGRKVGYLFTSKKTEYEVGYGECALVGGVNTTKGLYDGAFKMPKVMKDMANSILSTLSSLSYHMCIVGYLIAENAIQLLTLDFPAGYVARLDGFGPVYFPKAESEISNALPSALRLIMAGRQMMESSKAKIEQYKGPVLIAKRIVTCGHIVPTFMPTAAQVKKRRTSNKL